MADHCCFCDIRRPEGGTNHLVLNGGSTWIEFCPACGEVETLHNPDLNLTCTVGEIYRAAQEDRDPEPCSPELAAQNPVVKRRMDEDKSSEFDKKFNSLGELFPSP